MTESFQPKGIGEFADQTDVGSARISGTCEYNPVNGTYIVTGAGQNIWGNHDDFHFVWRRMLGNFIVTTRAMFISEGVNPHRKLGWMARSSLDASSSEVCAAIHGDGLLSLQFRRTPHGKTEEVQAALKGADVI